MGPSNFEKKIANLVFYKNQGSNKFFKTLIVQTNYFFSKVQ
jgi:hypothetical protein